MAKFRSSVLDVQRYRSYQGMLHPVIVIVLCISRNISKYNDQLQEEKALFTSRYESSTALVLTACEIIYSFYKKFNVK